MIDDVSQTPGLEQMYRLQCGRRTLIDAFPGLFRNRSEALRTALNILKCPNWAVDQPQHIVVEPAGLVLGVGDIGERLAVMLDAIAGRAVRVIERPSQQPHPRICD